MSSCDRAKNIYYLTQVFHALPSGEKLRPGKKWPVKVPHLNHAVMPSTRVWDTSSYLPPTRGPEQLPRGEDGTQVSRVLMPMAALHDLILNINK